MNADNVFISIIVLVHNAPRYVSITFDSLKKTEGVNYEVIVVDNDSKSRTKNLLLKYFKKGHINKLLFLDENTLFAKGNNIGSELCDKRSTHILLLNSDVEIRDKNWLSILLQNHTKGATSFGLCVNKPLRADGYCFLIDTHLYKEYRLDENFEWWWSVTKLQGLLLHANYRVLAINGHDNLIYHFGGRSGKSFLGAKGLTLDFEEVNGWFEQSNVEILDFNAKDEISKFNKYWRKVVDLLIN